MTQYKPDGYHDVNTYLVINNIDRELEFLNEVFDAKPVEIIKDKDGNTNHAEVLIGDSRIMLGPVMQDNKPFPAMLYVYVEDTDAIYEKAIKAGAESIMKPENMFYGDRNAGIKDKEGCVWWIATHVKQVSQEEMEEHIKNR